MTATPSSISAAGSFSFAAARKVVADAKAMGLIKIENTSAPAAWPPRKSSLAPTSVAQLDQPGAPVPEVGARRTVWVDVSPEQAAAWLKNNFVNRPLLADVVQAYARDMRNGVWVPTHQGIAFNDLNALIDGQHRLSAIVLSGLTVNLMVTYGLPAKIKDREMTTMDAVDRGRTRSVADQLKIQHGFSNGAVVAAVCAGLGGICFGERTKRLSVGQTLEIYREFQSGADFVITHRSREHGLRAAGVLAAFAFAITATDPSPIDLRATFRALIEGDNLVERSPLQALHKFLISSDARLLTRGSDRGLAELVLQALHLDIEGAKIDKLELSQDGAKYFRSVQADRVQKIANLFKLSEA